MKNKLLLLGLIVLLLSSCKKSDALFIDEASNSQLVNSSSLRSFFNHYKDSSGSNRNIEVDKIYNSLNMASIAKKDYLNDEDIYVVDMNNYHPIKDTKESGLFKLVLFVNKNGKIRTGKVLKFINTQSSTIADNIILSFFGLNTKSLTATFEFFNFYGNMFERMSYDKGHITERDKIEIKPLNSNGGNNARFQHCNQYWMVYRFFDQNGDLVTTYGYLLWEDCFDLPESAIADQTTVDWIQPANILDVPGSQYYKHRTINWSYSQSQYSSLDFVMDFSTTFTGIGYPVSMLTAGYFDHFLDASTAGPYFNNSFTGYQFSGQINTDPVYIAGSSSTAWDMQVTGTGTVQDNFVTFYNLNPFPNGNVLNSWTYLQVFP